MLTKVIISINVSIILHIYKHYAIENLYLCRRNKIKQSKWKY